jgi:NAD(P)-dependent dehydrogenase (short-subunit alcohol dehydrogenase family)
MTKRFGATTTTDEVLQGVDLRGERILVTGVSAGLGVETARALAAQGAQVVGAVRDLDKAKRATERVRRDAANGGSLELVLLDLASLASVRAGADALLDDGQPFDLVICNAGVAPAALRRTADGFEMAFGANHLGHFVFVNRIAQLMKPGARLVNLSSAGHRLADVDLDDPNFERTPFNAWTAYARSKTANALFTVEFDRRHQSQGLRATAVHPGVIVTELGRDIGGAEAIRQRQERLSAEQTALGRPPLVIKSIPQGAATSVWAGVVAEADEVGGRYCEDCRVARTVEPGGDELDGVRPYAVDPARAKALWAKSEDLVGERFADPTA